MIASEVVLSVLLPLASLVSMPNSSMNAPRVPEPSSRDTTSMAPLAVLPAAALSESVLLSFAEELPQPASAPISSIPARDIAPKRLILFIAFIIEVLSFVS